MRASMTPSVLLALICFGVNMDLRHVTYAKLYQVKVAVQCSDSIATCRRCRL